MRPPDVDLVVDRLVLDGRSLAPEQADELAVMVEEELGLLLAGAGWGDPSPSSLVEVKATALAAPGDPRALARALARRLAAETDLHRRLDGRT